MHKIGEDRSERLDIVPAQLRVIVTVRPKYACRTCTDGVTQGGLIDMRLRSRFHPHDRKNAARNPGGVTLCFST
jgi:transposase